MTVHLGTVYVVDTTRVELRGTVEAMGAASDIEVVLKTTAARDRVAKALFGDRKPDSHVTALISSTVHAVAAERDRTAVQIADRSLVRLRQILRHSDGYIHPGV